MNGPWKHLVALSALGLAAACATAAPEPAEPELPPIQVPAPEEPAVEPPEVGEPEVVPPEDPAPERGTMEYLEKAPTYTPYTDQPDIVNRSDVAQAIDDAYPKDLREAGVGGTTTVWFFLDTEGEIQRLMVNKSSGNQQLDDAAIEVASIVEFTPALNREEPVAVWISLPITFAVR